MPKLQCLTLSVLTVSCLLAVTESAPAVSISIDGKGAHNLRLPLFRAPNQQEMQESPHPILWSANETGDSLMELPESRSVRLACLVDGIGANQSVPVQTLIWTLVNETTGQLSSHGLHGPAGEFRARKGHLELHGSFSEWTGSTLVIAFPAGLWVNMRIGCEFVPAGMTDPIRSSGLILWDEQSEIQRLSAAKLQCTRTYHSIPEESLKTEFVIYNCDGIGDTRLLQHSSMTLVLHASSPSSITSPGSNVTTAKLTTYYKLLEADYMFAFAFDGHIRFGWSVRTSGPGKAMLRLLNSTGSVLTLQISSSMPSGKNITLNLTVPFEKVTTVIKDYKMAILDHLLFHFESKVSEVQLDELSPNPFPALSCPVACSPYGLTKCWVSWLDPQGSLAGHKVHVGLAGRPIDRSVGQWSCRIDGSNQSVSYAVSQRPRPHACGPRIPRRSVMFPPDRLTITCTMCGLAATSTLQFDVFASVGAATYSLEQTEQRHPNGSASITLSFSRISPTSGGAALILRCRATESSTSGAGTRFGTDFATVHFLPVPQWKPLFICTAKHNPCTVDCRSLLQSHLASLGVSVSHVISLHSSTDLLYKLVHNSSGVLEDAWKTAAVPVDGVLKPQCKQLYFYTHSRDHLSVNETFVMDSDQDRELYRTELGPERFGRLILAVSVKVPGTPHSVTASDTDHSRAASTVFMVISVISLAIVLSCLFVFLKPRVSRGPDGRFILSIAGRQVPSQRTGSGAARGRISEQPGSRAVSMQKIVQEQRAAVPDADADLRSEHQRSLSGSAAVRGAAEAEAGTASAVASAEVSAADFQADAERSDGRSPARDAASTDSDAASRGTGATVGSNGAGQDHWAPPPYNLHCSNTELTFFRPQSPADLGFRPHSPANLGSRPQSPANLRSRSQSPAEPRSRPQSPADLRSRPQSPADLRSRSQSPADLRSRPQSPANLGSRPQSPANPHSRSDSSASVALVGFDFCLNKDTELQDSQTL